MTIDSGSERTRAADLVMRSKLFVPGSRPELFAKALAGEAEGSPSTLRMRSRRAVRRRHASRWASSSVRCHLFTDKVMIVRVNGLQDQHYKADLDAVAWPALNLLNLPVVESADDVRTAAADADAA